MKKNFHIVFICFLLFLIIFCSNPEKQFNDAKIKGTIDAYETFLTKFPDSKFALLAKDSLDNLYYKKAKGLGTIDSYMRYLNKFPNGKFILQAKDSLYNIEFKNALDLNTIESYEQFLKKYPESELSNKVKIKYFSLKMTVEEFEEITAETRNKSVLNIMGGLLSFVESDEKPEEYINRDHNKEVDTYLLNNLRDICKSKGYSIDIYEEKCKQLRKKGYKFKNKPLF